MSHLIGEGLVHDFVRLLGEGGNAAADVGRVDVLERRNVCIQGRDDDEESIMLSSTGKHENEHDNESRRVVTQSAVT